MNKSINSKVSHQLIVTTLSSSSPPLLISSLSPPRWPMPYQVPGWYLGGITIITNIIITRLVHDYHHHQQYRHHRHHQVVHEPGWDRATADDQQGDGGKDDQQWRGAGDHQHSPLCSLSLSPSSCFTANIVTIKTR